MQVDCSKKGMRFEPLDMDGGGIKQAAEHVVL